MDYIHNPDQPKYLYLCCHPERRDEYKIGVGKSPDYRTKKCHGGLLLLDSVKGRAEDVLAAELEILTKTLDNSFRPSKDEFKDGHTEWRRGENTVKVWHSIASQVSTV